MMLLHRTCALTAAIMLGAVVVNGRSAEQVLTIPLPGGAPTLDRSFGRQPLAFEPNGGQTDAQVKFLARGKGYQLFLTDTEAVMVLSSPNASDGAERLGVRQPSAALWDGFGYCKDHEFSGFSHGFESGAGAPQSKTLSRSRGRVECPPGLGVRQPSAAFRSFEEPSAGAFGPLEPSPSSPHSRVLRMRLVGANASPPVYGEAELTGKVNYFIGNDPSRWRTNIPTFAKVQYRDVYPGTDLVYYGNQAGRLEYDFALAPGADPNQIALEFDGADRIELDAHGDLIAWVGGRPVRWQKPLVYQEFNGRRTEIAGAYRLDGGSLTYRAKSSHRIGFELAAYDRSQPLVIDPVLVYSTYLGGSGSDGSGVGSIVADSQGNTYVVGSTSSPDFPVANALQSVLGGTYDAFVAKMSPCGELLFSTYLGGAVGTPAFDSANGVALDAAENIHIAGHTLSDDFPLVDPLQSAFGGPWDAFVSILSPDGAEIRFSTYWGGTHAEAFNSIALDPVGNIYLTGLATEGEGEPNTDFPVHNALQPQYRGKGDAVVVKLSAGGTGVVYSTYFGGSRGESGYRIAADAEGFAYIAGTTDSSNLPVTNAYKPRFTGDSLSGSSPPLYWRDGYFAKITPNGSALSYCSYFGGTGEDYMSGLALGPNGDLWLAAQVSSSGLATPGAFQTSVPQDSWKSLVARFNATNGMQEAATYLEGGVPYDIGIDAAGNVWAAGMAFDNLPLVDPLQPYSGEVSGWRDGFVAKISNDCSRLLFSTYFGGTEADDVYSLCLAPNGDVLLFGQTKSGTDFPLLNAFQPQHNGGEWDTFIARISMGAVLKMSLTGQTVILSWPIGATNFVLEATTSLPAVSWTTVTNTPTVTTTNRSVQLPPTGNAKFFRLRKP